MHRLQLQRLRLSAKPAKALPVGLTANLRSALRTVQVDLALATAQSATADIRVNVAGEEEMDFRTTMKMRAAASSALPPLQLKLSFVHGFRGYA